MFDLAGRRIYQGTVPVNSDFELGSGDFSGTILIYKIDLEKENGEHDFLSGKIPAIK